MILHYGLASPHHTSSKVVITVTLLPWLQYLEDDSQRAICKNWLSNKFNTDPWNFWLHVMWSQVLHCFFFSISNFNYIQIYCNKMLLYLKTIKIYLCCKRIIKHQVFHERRRAAAEPTICLVIGFCLVLSTCSSQSFPH